MFTFHPPGRQLPKLVFTPAKLKAEKVEREQSTSRGEGEIARREELDQQSEFRAESVHRACGFAESADQTQGQHEGARESAKPQAQRTLPVQDSPEEHLKTAPKPKNRGGRPTVLTADRRTALLHMLRRGQSRRYAAEKLCIDPAAITRAIHRDPFLAAKVRNAEEEGERFLKVYDRLYNDREVVIGAHPIVTDDVELEAAKEYLIGCGLPESTIRRMRPRHVSDPPPRKESESHLGDSTLRDIRIKPWRRTKR